MDPNFEVNMMYLLIMTSALLGFMIVGEIIVQTWLWIRRRTGGWS